MVGQPGLDDHCRSFPTETSYSLAERSGNNSSIPEWGQGPEQAPRPHTTPSCPAQAAVVLLLLEGWEGKMKASSSKISSETLGEAPRHQSLGTPGRDDLSDCCSLQRQLVTDQRSHWEHSNSWNKQVCSSTSERSLGAGTPREGLLSSSRKARRHQNVSHQPSRKHSQNTWATHEIP